MQLMCKRFAFLSKYILKFEQVVAQGKSLAHFLLC